jgi:hypothetical protein
MILAVILSTNFSISNQGLLVLRSLSGRLGVQISAASDQLVVLKLVDSISTDSITQVKHEIFKYLWKLFDSIPIENAAQVTYEINKENSIPIRKTTAIKHQINKENRIPIGKTATNFMFHY